MFEVLTIIAELGRVMGEQAAAENATVNSGRVGDARWSHAAQRNAMCLCVSCRLYYVQVPDAVPDAGRI